MRLLLIHSGGGAGWVALADASLVAPIAGVETLPGRGSSEALMPAIRRLFPAAGWGPGTSAQSLWSMGPARSPACASG